MGCKAMKSLMIVSSEYGDSESISDENKAIPFSNTPYASFEPHKDQRLSDMKSNGLISKSNICWCLLRNGDLPSHMPISRYMKHYASRIRYPTLPKDVLINLGCRMHGTEIIPERIRMGHRYTGWGTVDYP